MYFKKINLKEHYNLENDVYLDCYIIKNSEEININKKRKAIIILPGGGYNMVSHRESTPIARKFLANDISSFVLNYSTNTKFPTPMLEVFAAVDYLNKNKEEFNLSTISLCGFSAGGHLAGITAKFMEDTKYLDLIKVKNLNIEGLILNYPVVDFTTYAHEGSRDTLTQCDESLYELLSVHKNLKKFPKTFIWHTLEDNVVNPINSIELSKSLLSINCLHELHLFPTGKHGLSLGNEITSSVNYPALDKEAQIWIDLCLVFIEKNL